MSDSFRGGVELIDKKAPHSHTECIISPRKNKVVD